MTSSRVPKIYLAGPEVFFPDGEALIARKRALAVRYGFEPPPEDAAPWPKDKLELGLHISAMNERLMRQSDLIIANVTPFRGLSADVGTAYEIGFMCALGRAAFAYSNEPRGYTDRAIEFYGGKVAVAPDGVLRADDGQMVEDHGMTDNLMLDGGIILRKGAVVRPKGGERPRDENLEIFEQCLAAARRHFNAGI